MSSLTAAVKFAPRNALTSCGMDAKQVKAALASIGVVFGTHADDFSVRTKGQKLDDAYRTDDLEDALATGRAMKQSA